MLLKIHKTNILYIALTVFCLTIYCVETKNFSAGSEEESEVENFSSYIGRSDVKPSELIAHDEEETGGKHEMFASCPSIVLDKGEYILFNNGTAYVEAYNKLYNSSFYLHVGDNLVVCFPEEDVDESEKFPYAFFYITRIGLGISMVCLLLHVIVFCALPDLRNLPGSNLVALCVSLFFAYVTFLIAQSVIVDIKLSCVILAASSHFFYLSSFLWMSVIAYDILCSLLTATGKLRLKTTKFRLKKFLLYSLYAWGIALLFVAGALLLDNISGIPEDYRPSFGESVCWFGRKKPLLILFAAPVCFVAVLNAIFFGFSAYTIYANASHEHSEDSHKVMLRKNFLIYSRLAVIMGVTWILGVVASATDVMALWYIFIIFNTLQGLFIFLAFTFTTKVKTYIRVKLNLSQRRSSTATLPTFQSYYNHGFTTETNLSSTVNEKAISALTS